MDYTAHNCQQKGLLGKLESDIKTIFKRMDEQLAMTKAVYDLAAEVRVMNERMANFDRTQKEMKRDMDDLKAMPKNRWNSLVTAIVSAVAGGLVTFALFKLGLSI